MSGAGAGANGSGVRPGGRGGAGDSGAKSEPWSAPRSLSSSCIPKPRRRSVRSMVSGHLPQHADHPAEDAHLARADRLHGLVLRLQTHVVGLLEEALDRRLLADEGDDDLAVLRRVLPADDHAVVREDAGVLHRLAADAEQVLAVLAAGDLRHLDVVLDVLLREQRLARGDVADQRDAGGLDDRLHGVRRGGRRAIQQLDGPRLRRIAPQQTNLLQVRQVRVDRGGRREPDRLPDVPHRRRIAVARGVLFDEVEDLLLALRQVLSYVHAARLLSSRTCVRTRYKGSRTDSSLRAILALPRADGGIW